MKYMALILLLGLFLTGCRSNIPQETDGLITTEDTQFSEEESSEPIQTDTLLEQGTADTESARILQQIWDGYPEEERFSVYGGRVDLAVTDGPGDLDITGTDELTTRYLLPEAQLGKVTEGASLCHLMNSNIFTSAVFRLAESSEARDFADSWREAIRENLWICGQPDRLLLAQVDENHILMAFGSQELMPAFEQRLLEVRPDSQVLYKEAIVA